MCLTFDSPDVSPPSAGFGLGALNEADDDDLDVYDGGLSTYKRRVAYDHIQDDDSNVISSRGRKSGKQNIVRDSFLFLSPLST